MGRQLEDSNDWLQDAERWINQIKGVMQCKIDIDPGGDISGVHVVARQGRDPRHIVRDVEGLLKARLGIAVFYKKIGVVQVVEPADEEATVASPAAAAAEPVFTAHDLADEPDLGVDVEDADEDDSAAMDAVLLAEELAPRVKCHGVGIMSTEMSIRADVELHAAGVVAHGTAEGPNRSTSDLELVAQATLAAVRQLLDETIGLNLCEVRVESVGGQRVVLAAVELIEGRRTERLFGTCQPQQNLHQSVVFAVLDALNRRLALMVFRSGESAD